MSIDEDSDFRRWRERWDAVMHFEGPHVPNVERRIAEAKLLWTSSVPGDWKRHNLPPRVKSGYTRGNLATRKRGEHQIEWHIIDAWRKDKLTVADYDSVAALTNAYPLARGSGKKVEADMLAVVKRSANTDILLIEVKGSEHGGGSQNPWYAAVENLRQLKLFKENLNGNLKLIETALGMRMDQASSVVGIVMAPPDYFRCAGQKSNSMEPTRNLLMQLRGLGAVIRLVEWNKAKASIGEVGG